MDSAPSARKAPRHRAAPPERHRGAAGTAGGSSRSVRAGSVSQRSRRGSDHQRSPTVQRNRRSLPLMLRQLVGSASIGRRLPALGLVGAAGAVGSVGVAAGGAAGALASQPATAVGSSDDGPGAGGWRLPPETGPTRPVLRTRQIAPLRDPGTASGIRGSGRARAVTKIRRNRRSHLPDSDFGRPTSVEAASNPTRPALDQRRLSHAVHKRTACTRPERAPWASGVSRGVHAAVGCGRSVWLFGRRCSDARPDRTW